MYTVHCTLYTVHCTVCIVHHTMCSVQCIKYSVHRFNKDDIDLFLFFRHTHTERDLLGFD